MVALIMVKSEMEVSLYVWRSWVCSLAVGNRHGHWTSPSRFQIGESSRKGETGFQIGWLLERSEAACQCSGGRFPFSFFSKSTDERPQQSPYSFSFGGGGALKHRFHPPASSQQSFALFFFSFFFLFILFITSR